MLNLLLIGVYSIILAYSVKIFIESVSKISHKLKISAFTVSFILVALGTSLPELLVGINSSLVDKGVLSFANVIGSNIALVTLIVGIATFFGKGISTKHALISRDLYNAVIVSTLALGLSFDGKVSKIDGIILVTSYVLYSVVYLKRSVGFEKLIEKFDRVNIFKETLLFVGSLSIVLLVSNQIVKATQILSDELNISLGFIGLSITAIGTSLPEIAYSISAQIHHKSDEIIGNIVGSLVVNSTLVLGVTSLIKPVVISNSHIINSPSAFALIFGALLFLNFAKTKNKIDKIEGTILVVVYLIFLFVEYNSGISQ